MIIDHDADTGCAGCPFLRSANEPAMSDDECGVAPLESFVGGNYISGPAPDWCPLRDRSVMVRMVKGSARRDEE